MLCGGGFALSTIPKAATAYILPIVLGSALSFLMTDVTLFLTAGFLLGIYTYAIMYASSAYARLFISGLVTQTEVKKQGQIIGLLLRDFEEKR